MCLEELFDLDELSFLGLARLVGFLEWELGSEDCLIVDFPVVAEMAPDFSFLDTVVRPANAFGTGWLLNVTCLEDGDLSASNIISEFVVISSLSS